MTPVTARPWADGARRTPLTWWSATFVLAGVAGIVLRVWAYRSWLGVPDSDEAVVGLMVRHITHGELTTFFWGQAYGGTQEALLTAPLFWIFGSSWLALRIVPILLDAAAAIVLWRVALRLMSERAAAAAGAVFWIWPPFLIYKLTHQWGFYASGVLYCALLILLALRVVEEASRLRVGTFGLVLGLALWETEQIVPVAIPLIAWTVWKQPRCLRNAWVAVPLAALGALPWIVWNVRHGFGSFHSTVPDNSDYPHRLRLFLSPLLPIVLGLREVFSQKRIIPSPELTYLIEAILFGLFAWAAWRNRRNLRSILYVLGAVYPFLYAIPAETILSKDPKYLVVLMPILVLLVAQVATTYPRAVGLIALALVATVISLNRLDTFLRTVGPDPPIAPRDIRPLVATLDRFGLTRVYATFWVAYRIDFDTDERIIAAQSKLRGIRFRDGVAELPHNPHIRYEPYERKVASARHGFVFFDFEASKFMRSTALALERHHYRRVNVGEFVVFAPPARAG